MGADQDGHSPLPVQPQKQLPHLPDALRVQAVDGFVQQQQVRPAQQGQGHAQPLLYAHGAVFDRLFLPRGQPHRLQNPVYLTFRAVQPQQGGVQPQILPPAQIGVESRLFNEGPHPAAGHRVPDGLAENQRFSLCGPGQAAQEF